MPASQSDRHVLFGVLALQMEFITQAGLIAALQAWTLQKEKPLGELLVELGQMSADDRAALEPMVDRHIAGHRGSAEQSLAALSSVSDVAAELQQVNDADVQNSLMHVARPTSRQAGTLSGVMPSSEGEIPIAPPLTDVEAGWSQQLLPTITETLLEERPSPLVGTSQAARPTALRFQLLRPHAEGGLGKVWVAKDRELNREVAFKEIKPKRAQDRNSRGRFVLEAEITGGLEHPGIVPVYGLGHFADGRPFYAMRFIRGHSLKEAIKAFHHPANGGRQPSGQLFGDAASRSIDQQADACRSPDFEGLEFRKLVQRLIDVCNAIAYAHSRGVLHRDLKPGNIMLGKYGETLVVDWGLAKAKGQSFDPAESPNTSVLDQEPKLESSGSHDVAPTQMGSALGTPQFMSPEQAAGRLDLLGPAADVYSLGATLYELLTDQAPLSGLRIDEVLRRVETGDIPRPQDVIRSLRDRKADSKHASGQQADRVKSDPAQTAVGSRSEPATLKIPPALEAICLKAMSREPSARYATATALAEDLERWLAGDAVRAWREPVIVRAKRWVRRHQTLVTSTAAMLMVSIASLTALSIIVTGKNNALESANTRIQNQSTKISEQNATLEQSNAQLTVAKNTAEANAKVATEQSQLALATLNSVIFDLQRAFENMAGGTAVRQRLLATALEKLDQVSTKYAAQSAVDRNTMVALMALADTIQQLGQSSPHAPREESRARDDTPNTQPSDPTTKSAAVTAERLYRRAFEIAQKLAEADPNDAQKQRDLAISFSQLGDVFLTLGRTDDALAQFQDGLTIHRRLAEADPNDAQKQRDLSISFNRLGNVFLTLGRTDDALAQFQELLKRSRAAAEADPHDAQKQRDLSISFQRLGDVFLTLGRTDDALAQFEAKLRIDRVLVETDPKHTDNQRNLSISFERLGDIFLKLGRTDDALAQFEAKLRIDRVLVETDPKHTDNQRNLSISFERLGDVFLTLGRTDDALAQFQDGLTIRRRLAEADPNDAQKQRDLSVSFGKLGNLFLKLGRTDDALAQFQDSLTISRTLAEADPNDAQKQRDLSISFERLGDVFLTLGRTDDTLAQFQDGLTIRRRLAEADPNDAQKQRDLSISFNRLGNVFLTLGRTDDALAQFQDSLTISRRLAEADPNDAQKQRDLSISLEGLGDVYLKLGCMDDALAQFQEDERICRRLAKADPHDAQKQRDLSISLERLGVVFAMLGCTDDALAQFQDGLTIRRRLAESDPNDAQKQRDLMISHFKLGEVAVQTRQYDEAMTSFQDGIAVLDRMIANNQAVAASKNEKAFLQQRLQFCQDAKLAFGDWDTLLKLDAKLLPSLLYLRATEMLNRDELAQAVQVGDKLRELDPKDNDNLYSAACVYALCAEHVTKNKPTPTDAEQAERQKFLKLALDSLKASLAAGFDNFEHMQKDDDLKPLHGLPEFEALFPKKP